MDDHSNLEEEEVLNGGRDKNASTSSMLEQEPEMSQVRETGPIVSRPGANKRKMKHDDLTSEVLTTVRDHFKQDKKPELSDRYELFGKSVAHRLRSLGKYSALLTEKKINDILFDAEIAEAHSSGSHNPSSAPSPLNSACTTSSPTFQPTSFTNVQHEASAYTHSDNSVANFFSQYNPNLV